MSDRPEKDATPETTAGDHGVAAPKEALQDVRFGAARRGLPDGWALLAAAVTFLAGVLVATIPAIVTSHMQANAQERQLLLDRRIAAMHSYLAACNRAAAPYAYPSELLVPSEPPRGLAEVVAAGQQRELLAARVGELRAQEALVAALFRINRDTLGLPSGWPPNAPNMTMKEMDEWLSQRAGAAQMRCVEVGEALGQRLFLEEDAVPIALPPAVGPPVAPEKARAWQAPPSASPGH